MLQSILGNLREAVFRRTCRSAHWAMLAVSGFISGIAEAELSWAWLSRPLGPPAVAEVIKHGPSALSTHQLVEFEFGRSNHSDWSRHRRSRNLLVRWAKLQREERLGKLTLCAAVHNNFICLHKTSVCTSFINACRRSVYPRSDVHHGP